MREPMARRCLSVMGGSVQRTLSDILTIMAVTVASALLAGPVRAGSEANFVLYDFHTGDKGETEVNVFSDFSSGTKADAHYNAQLFEIEHALTDRLTTALYLEGDDIDGGNYQFGGWRLEGRYRLLDYGAFLNPVLYVEYENLQPERSYVLDVVGRTDAADGPKSAERDIESKLILGGDVTNDLSVDFNWINETNLDTGRWDFGYAFGLNYALVGVDQEAEPPGKHWAGKGTLHSNNVSDWMVKEIKLGAELYGGLGDSVLGLTFDPDRTQQYAGLNLLVEANEKRRG